MSAVSIALEQSLVLALAQALAFVKQWEALTLADLASSLLYLMVSATQNVCNRSVLQR